jgi:hypothetical protein
MPPSNKRKTDSKDYWYSKDRKKLQKKSLQQNSNNHEPDDESSVSSGKKRNTVRVFFQIKKLQIKSLVQDHMHA